MSLKKVFLLKEEKEILGNGWTGSAQQFCDLVQSFWNQPGFEHIVDRWGTAEEELRRLTHFDLDIENFTIEIKNGIAYASDGENDLQWNEDEGWEEVGSTSSDRKQAQDARRSAGEQLKQRSDGVHVQRKQPKYVN